MDVKNLLKIFNGYNFSKYFFNYAKDPLFRNSFFIGITRVFNAGCGFLFWNFAARYYSINDVGVASAIISYLGLILLLGKMGFDISLIRFMPLRNKDEVFNSFFWIVIAVTGLISIIFVGIVPIASSELSFIRNYVILFLIISIMQSIYFITQTTFVSIRKAEYYFAQDFFSWIRIPILTQFITFGAIGIIISFGITYFVVSIISLYLISKFIDLRFNISVPLVKESFNYSSINYISNLFLDLPYRLMPLIIFNLIGPEDAAKYYIAFAIGNLVMIIPSAFGLSFFVEGSYTKNYKMYFLKAGFYSYILLIPLLIFIFLFGDYLLSLFGDEYVDATLLLRLIVSSSIFLTLYELYIPLQNLKFRAKSVLYNSFLRCFLLICLSCIFIQYFGISGVGWSFIASYIILDILILKDLLLNKNIR